MAEAVTERPYVPGAVHDAPESQLRSAALYIMRRQRRNPVAMWELLEALGLTSVARELLAERIGRS